MRNNQGGIRIHLAMDYYRTKKQGNSRTNYLKGKKEGTFKKYDDSGKIISEKNYLNDELKEKKQ